MPADQHATRLRAIDPLLAITDSPTTPPADPADENPAGPAGESPAELVAGGTRGRAWIVDLDPANVAASWSRLRTYGLTPRWTGDPAELDELLRRWLDWMRAAGAADAGPDSQTFVTWPSRDVDAGRVFYAHGMMPSTTFAIRLRGRPPVAPAADLPAGVTIRRAGVPDAAAIVALGAEELRYESGLSPLGERPGHTERRRQETAAALDRPEPWAWIAERDGAPVGVLAADRPEDAARQAALTSCRPAAYVSLLSVTAAERGSGIGGALAAVALRTFDDAGMAASVLHHGTFNPLSGPFWCRQGYRPLWTTWATQPAAAQR